MSYGEVGELEGFLDPGYRYALEQDPLLVRSVDDARRSGLNCESLGHLVVSSVHGVVLPPGLRCYEMFGDQEWLSSVPEGADWQLGDLILLGEANPARPMARFKPEYDTSGNLINWDECPLTHVAIGTGKRDDSGDPLLLHASPEEGTTTIWPLRKFGERSRYKQIYRVGRVRPENELPINQSREHYDCHSC